MTTISSQQSHLLSGKPKFLSTESYGLVIIGISALLYSVMGCFVKLATVNDGLPSTEIVFMRALFQGSIVVTAMLFYRENASSYYGDNNNNNNNSQVVDAEEEENEGNVAAPVPRILIFSPLGSPMIRSVVIARGLMGGLGFIQYYYTISALPLGDAVALLSLSPVITVMAAAVMGEPMRPLHILAACTTVVGSFLIARPDFVFGPSSSLEQQLAGYNPLGYCTAAGGCLTSTGVFLLMRKAGKIGAHTLQLLFSWVVFGLLFSFLLGVAAPLLDGKWYWALPSKKVIWGYILGCCCFGSTAHFLLNFAGRHSNPGLVAIVRSSGILWAYVLQVVVFDQIPTFLTCAGVVFVSLSLTMVSIQKIWDGQLDVKECKIETDERANLVSHTQQTRYGTSA